MARAARVLEIILGLFFVVTAAMKAFDVEAFAVQISTYGLKLDTDLMLAIAYSVIGLETFIGVFLLAGLRLGGFVYSIATLMTIIFSLAVAYAWQYRDLEDCGCFGEFVKMDPPTTLIKNGVLLALLVIAWAGTTNLRHRYGGYRGHYAARAVTALVALALVAGVLYYDYTQRQDEQPQIADQSGTATDSPDAAPVAPPALPEADPDRPFARIVFTADGQQHDLGQGEHLVAFLSATCDHCKASVPGINEYNWQGNLPPLVAIMQSDSPQALEDFRLMTEPLFPTYWIRDLDFFYYLDGAPPQLFYVVNGKSQATWTWEEDPPAADQVQSQIGMITGRPPVQSPAQQPAPDAQTPPQQFPPAPPQTTDPDQQPPQTVDPDPGPEVFQPAQPTPNTDTADPAQAPDLQPVP